ncbi:carboxypeptidase-like regulatory domain-containing protein [Sutcliffiella deserti]|uniref:carboxypeptidase-like regulatory domain-containing protein n=1 Tax=Sutcliffiella deserti TaxID=2875501 RepID=UPI001CBF8504|nr:carboxypeptidase-like regulatory domain-containing protein [Sutcliffiella deserti]
MQIKITSKQLYITGLIALLVGSFTLYSIQPQIEARSIETGLANGEEMSKQRLFELLESNQINKQEKNELIETFIVKHSYSEFNEVFISPPNIATPVKKNIDFMSMEEKLPYLYYYLENSEIDAGYVIKVAKILNAYGWKTNNTEEIQLILLDAFERYEEDSINGPGISQIILHQQITDGQFDEALAFSDELLQKDFGFNFYLSIAKTKAELLIRKDSHDEAFETIAAIEEYLDENEIRADESYVSSVKALRQMLRNEPEPSTVSGTIDFNGEMLDGTGVYLVNHPEGSMQLSQALKYRVISDENGRFSFDNILPGRYKLVIGLDYDHITDESFQSQLNYPIEVNGEDKEVNIELAPLLKLTSPVNYEEVSGDNIRFSWEEVEGAFSYAISFGIEGAGTSTLVFPDVRTNELVVSKEEMSLKRLGIQKGNASRVYEAMLAFSNPSTVFYWYVTAYNEEGFMVGRSNGYKFEEEHNLPYFSVNKEEISSADETLLDGDVEEALEEYKNNVEKDPTDAHSINMVRTLSIHELEYDRVDQLLKQEPYLVELAEISPNIEILSELMEFYYYTKSWEALDRTYNEYNRLDQYNLFAELIYIKGQYSQGNVNEARRLADELYVKDFQSDLAIVHLGLTELILGEGKKTLEIASNYSNSRLDWEAKVRELMKHYDKEQMEEFNSLFTTGRTKELEERLGESPNNYLVDFWRSVLTYAK